MTDTDTQSTDASGAALATSLRRIGEREPLIQAVTNTVTITDVANLVHHWGALPVMADSPGDAGEMAAAAGALLLNTGQIPETRVEAMHEAARAATERGIPVVLDPVGVGSTPSRDAVVEALLTEIDVSVIKGNYGEISALAGVEAEVRGVESVGDYEGIGATARSLADSSGATVVASGVADVVADGERAVRVSAGHELLGEVVGTGCMLGGTIAAFRGAVEDDFRAALHATLAFGVAGERAAESPVDGPASYRTHFHDAVYGLTPDVASDLDLEGRIGRVD